MKDLEFGNIQQLEIFFKVEWYRRHGYIHMKNKFIKKNEHDLKRLYYSWKQHEPIISKKFLYVRNWKIKKRTEWKRFNRYLFSGMFILCKCGHTLGIREKKTKSTISQYTSCNHYCRKGKLSGCTPNRLNYHLLEKDILHYLNNVGEEFYKYYNIQKLVEDSVYIFNRDIEEIEKQLEIIDNNISNKINIISNLYNDKIEGIISKQFIKVYQKSWKE